MTRRRTMVLTAAAAAAAFLTACASGGSTSVASGPEASEGPSAAAPSTSTSGEVEDLLYGTPNGAWRSSYEPYRSRPTLIRGGIVMTAAGDEIEGGDVLMRDGRIEDVGRDLEAPEDAVVVDASDRWVTPGLVDTHSHLGVYPSPSVDAHSDGNEATDPTTPEVWAEHSVWPQDPGFVKALAGGVTTLQVLPGSANLVGGRGVTLKPIPARTVQDMMFPDAPMALKMACGENPKRVYRNSGPSTRMGNVAGYREAFLAAREYRREWDAWIEGGRQGDPPDRDLGLESLAEVLRGHVLVHNHCYRADEMAQMIELGHEFGFKVRSFHHAVEAYKIRDLLAEERIAASMWVDWWGFKMEAYDGIPENIGLVSEAGAPAVLHTDSDLGIQIMNQDAARAMHAAREAGVEVDRNEALRWVTANPAWALDLDDRIGTLEPGKNADVVIWSDDPFSVYSRADRVYVDGALVYERTGDGAAPSTDFEVGILPRRDVTDGGER